MTRRAVVAALAVASVAVITAFAVAADLRERERTFDLITFCDEEHDVDY